MKAKNNGEMSYDQIREMVCMAICDRLGKDAYCYVVDLYSDRVVYETAEHYYECTYAMAADKVTLGDAAEVQREVSYAPIKAAGQIMAAKADDASGFKWAVRVAAFGKDLNGNYWDKAVMTAALAQFEGAKVFALKEAQHQAKAHKFGKSVLDLVGVLSSCQAAADGIYADLTILPAAAWLRDNLVGCAEMGLNNVLGLSVDVSGILGSKMEGGKKMPMMTSINKVTVDVVYDPVAKGEFLTMAAARQADQQEDDMLQKLLAALRGNRPDLYKQITEGMTAGTISEDQAVGMVAAATVTAAGGDAASDQLVAAVVAGFKETLTAAGSEELQEVRTLACGMTLDRELAASKLPDAAQLTIRQQFAGKTFETAGLQAAIKTTKELVDSLTGSGGVYGLGELRASVGRESGDKLQAAFDGLFNVPRADDLKAVPIFTSLRAAYVEMTGDTDISGVLNPQLQRRMQAAYGDLSFAYALGNTLYRRVVADYREINDYGVSRVVGSNIRNAVDFRPLQSVRIGYYGDLPTLNTDTDDYPDLGEVSDEKIEYALQEKGGIITINRRTIINDDLRLVQKIVSRLPRAARRTLARRVFNPFITNANYGADALPIFHATHGNFGAAAYDIASALAARNAMLVQTEPGSGERTGCCGPATVMFPVELFGIVKNVNEFNPQQVSIANGNSMYGYFKPEGLLQQPLITDATDWYFFADPNDCEIVELAFLNGQQEPQMLVADNPAVGQTFLGGRIQYRVNHDYEAAVVDFRGAYKAVVAG